MDFRTELTPQDSSFKIDYSQQGLMLGSCFVENIGAKMNQIKLPVDVNPLGIIYNPLSIAKTLERLATKKLVGEDELFFDGHLWRHYDFHSRFCATDKAVALDLMNRAIEQGHEKLKASSYIILTLGTARVYRLNSSLEVVCNCHKTPQKEFSSFRVSVDEIAATLLNIIDKYLSDKQIILTVSPIRHIKDGFEENSRSKATLLLAAEKVCVARPKAIYFPSYEIVMDDLRDYRFYASDMVHPSPVAIDYIWQKFTSSMFADSTIEVAKKVEKVIQALSHRPFNPDSDAHRAFMERTRTEAKAITSEYACITFE